MKLICLALVAVAALAGIGSVQRSPVAAAPSDTRSEWISNQAYTDCMHRARALGHPTAMPQTNIATCKKAWLLSGS